MNRSLRTSFRVIVAGAMALGAAGSAPARHEAAAAPPAFAGPFEMRQALTLHVVNPSGGAFRINLGWADPTRERGDRPLLVRVFDPQERLIVRHDAPGERGGPIEQSVTLDVPDRGPGVYQVALTGHNPSVRFDTEPALSFGVFGYPHLACRDQQFADAHVYLPPGLDALTIRGGEGLQSVLLRDHAGAERMRFAGAAGGIVALPAEVAEEQRVWRLSVEARGVGTLNFAGMPVILCPDRASAQAIRSSVDMLDDGTICFHKFQVRAHELLRGYRALPPSSFVVRPPLLVRQKDLWLADPVRNQLLLGPYGVFAGLDAVLAAQNMDAASPWFGCIHAWRDGAGRLRAENPWTRCDRLGLARAASTVNTLAAVYSVRERFNPLASDAALLKRIIIASLQELMLIREHELPLPEFTEYPGADRSFTLARFTFAFPLIARDCPEDVRSVLTEGFQRCIDHESANTVPNTVNQWTFIIRAIQQFREGVGEPGAADTYAALVQRHVNWLLTRAFDGWGWMPAGYFAESGPDATYVGITLHNLGWIAHRTGDEQLREALRRCIDLFNHTVAPEPPSGAAAQPAPHAHRGGVWMGATNFCSRTPDDWSKPQWGAGIAMLADDFSEAAPLVGRAWWALPKPVGLSGLRAAETQLAASLAYLSRQAFREVGEPVLQDAAEIAFLNWQHFAEHPLQGELPMVSAQPFTRNFGDEFFCVRRPGYYAFLYAGAPMHAWQKSQRSADSHKQHPRNAGGLSMFWTPGLGVSLLAKNWSAYAAQTIIVERSGDAAQANFAAPPADWEDYWSVRREFEAQQARARITATILNQPIDVEREVRFFDDAVRYDLTLTVRQAPDARAVWECFPFPLDKPQPLEVTLLDEGGRSIGAGPALAICFSAGGEEVHVIAFDRPRRCLVGEERSVDHYNNPRRHGRVLAEIPDALRTGETTVRWLMFSTAKSRLSEALATARRRLQE